MTQIIVPITSACTPLSQQVERARRLGADVVELRVDLIDDLAAVEQALAAGVPLPVLVTLRDADEGGAWRGSDEEKAALLTRLLRYRLAMLDVELRAWQRSSALRTAADSARAAGTRLVLSCHDLRGTPADIAPLIAELEAAPTDLRKAVWMATEVSDALRVLDHLRRRQAPDEWIMLAAGEAGLLTRVLARKLGAAATFAALERGAESAPGQCTLAELHDIYHHGRISPATSVYGVIGWPVSHSRSPHVHNAAMRRADIDGVYVALPVADEPHALAQALSELIDTAWLDCRGLSVTIPHKERTLGWARERGWDIRGAARDCGAANTVIREADGTWSVDNTDVTGAALALRPYVSAGARALVLGAGGAARAIVAALMGSGCRVAVSNRSADRAAEIALQMGCDTVPWEHRGSQQPDVLVNTTTLGMGALAGQSPFPDGALRPGMVVMDVVYTPRQTRLLQDAARVGCKTVTGVEMFLHQAAAQFQLWHGRPAPLDIMRAALPAD